MTDGGQPRRIDVPVEIPQGMKHPSEVKVVGVSRGVLNVSANLGFIINSNGKQPAKAMPRRARSGSGGGIGPGRGGNAGGGVPSPSPNSPASVLGTLNSDPPAPPSPGDGAEYKLHPSVLALVERLRQKQPIPTGEQYKFIRAGKAEVQIWLTDKSDDTLAKLKELGFEVMLDPKTSKVIIGRIPIEKLEGLVALKFVRYVAPQAFK